jgi:type IV secretion system protein VirB7
MIKKACLLCMAVALAGCAAITYPLPKCDGYSRRPLNRSMWRWEDKSDLKQKRADAPSITSGHLIASYAAGRMASSPLEAFDIPSSYRRCEG